MSTWYKKGKSGINAAKQAQAEAKTRRDNAGPQRFWLKNDTAGKITFLDTPTFFCDEHNIEINGKYGNYVTCIKEMDTCPACEDGIKSSYILVGTIIDHRKWVGKDDKVHIHEKKLFVAKGRAQERLIRQIELRDGDLKHHVYEVARGSSKTECGTGLRRAA